MALQVAIVGASPVTAALEQLLGRGGDLSPGEAEVAVAVDPFAEWILASCVIDPVWFTAHAALRALRALGEARG